MKDISNNFDQLIKSKLEDVEVAPALADAYWQQMQLPIIRQTGASKSRRYYWFGASVILILVILAVTKPGRNTAIDFNTKIIQQPKKATSINTNDTVTMMNEEQIIVSQTKVESHSISKENDLNKSSLGKSIIEKNQSLDKPIDDSTFNHQTTATLNAFNQLKEDATAMLTKESSPLTGIQQADSNLKKIDSLSKKPEAKKKAPYIIW